MEKFVINAFSEQLSQFIVGFHKDQINTNLLKGNGEISNFHLNVDTINSMVLRKVTPYFRLESAFVTRVYFNVTSFTNLKKSPIVISVDEIYVKLVEPLEYEPLVRKKAEKKKKQPYGLIQRIGDNIKVQIKHVNIKIETMGKFKTRTKGLWTPPTFQIKLNNIQYELTDEFGEPGSPEIIWRNSKVVKEANGIDRSPVKTLLIYKKCSVDVTVGLLPTTTKRDESECVERNLTIIQDGHVEAHFAMKRRLYDAAMLSVQVDLSLNNIEINLDHFDIQTIHHALVGMLHCMGKDRSFRDPLMSQSKEASFSGRDKNLMESSKLKEEKDKTINCTNNDLEDVDDDDENEDDIDDYVDENDEDDHILDAVDMEDSLENSFESEIHANKVEPTGKLTESSNERNSNDMKPANGAIVTMGASQNILIYENFTFTLSLHRCGVRVSYAKSYDSYVKMDARGLILEVILRKEYEMKRGYFQFSLSNISIFERHNKIYTPIIIGGIEECGNNSVRKAIKKKNNLPKQVAPDENFPLFESRSIRDDPLDLRHSFPLQAFGWKTIINMDDERHAYMPLAVHEIGINQFELVCDAAVIQRIMSLASTEGTDFDERWYTGNWKDMTLGEVPTARFDYNVNNCIQNLAVPKTNVELYSNVTFKASIVGVRIPAALEENIYNCDILMGLDEIMLIVSPALPRSFLVGKIVGYRENNVEISQENKSEEVEMNLESIQYPNDRNDLCFSNALHESIASVTDDKIPKIQLTFSSFSIELLPFVSMINNGAPWSLFFISNLTTLVCLDSFEVNYERVLFLSTLIRNVDVNIDIELVPALVGTLNYHKSILQSTFSNATLTGMECDVEDLSFKTDFILTFQIQAVATSIWQKKSPINVDDNRNCIERVLLVKLCCDDMEIGTETYKLLFCPSDAVEQLSFRNNGFLIKLCVSSFFVEIVDGWNKSSSSFERSNGDEAHDNICVLALGKYAQMEHKCTDNENGGQNSLSGLSLRLEVLDAKSSSFAISAELGNCVLNLDTAQLVSLFEILIESAFRSMPSQPSKRNTDAIIDKDYKLFPNDSVGAFFESILQQSNHVRRKEQTDLQLTFSSISLENVSIMIPEQATNDNDGKAILLGAAFIISNLKLSFVSIPLFIKNCYPVSVVNSSKRWDQLFDFTSPGIYFGLKINCNVSEVEINGVVGKIQSCTSKLIIPDFGGKCCVQPANVRIDFRDLNTNCTDIKLLERWFTIAFKLKEDMERFLKQYSFFSRHVTAAISPKTTESTFDKATILELIQDSRRKIKKIVESFAAVDMEIYSHFSKKKNEESEIKRNMFLKEKQRVAAISLLCHQHCGWIRVGDSSISGQRVISAVNLSRFWLVLRNSMIIIFSSPGMLTPRDFISIDGATVRSVTSGKLRKDAKRGFIITEKNGKQRILVTENEDEYLKWTESLMKALQTAQKMASLSRNAETSVSSQYSVDSVKKVGDKSELKAVEVQHSEEKNCSEKKVNSGKVINESDDESCSQEKIGNKILNDNRENPEELKFQRSDLGEMKRSASSDQNMENITIGKIHDEYAVEGEVAKGTSIYKEAKMEEIVGTMVLEQGKGVTKENSEGKSNVQFGNIVDEKRNEDLLNEEGSLTGRDKFDDEVDSVSTTNKKEDASKGNPSEISACDANLRLDNVTHITTNGSEVLKKSDKESDVAAQTMLKENESFDAACESFIDDEEDPEKYETISLDDISGSYNEHGGSIQEVGTNKNKMNTKFPKFGAAMKSVRPENDVMKRMKNKAIQTKTKFVLKRELSLNSFDSKSSVEQNVQNLNVNNEHLKEEKKENFNDISVKDTGNRRDRLKQKMASINMNAKLSKLGNAMKSFSESEATSGLNMNTRSYQSTKQRSNQPQDISSGYNLPLEMDTKSDMENAVREEYSAKVNYVAAENMLSSSDQQLVNLKSEVPFVATAAVDDNVAVENNPRQRLKLSNISSINMNAKFSKIGAVMKSVRPDPEALKQLNSSKFRNISKSSMHNSTLKSRNPSTEQRDPGNKSKIRNVKVSNEPLSLKNTSIELKELKLYRIDGDWVVKVRSVWGDENKEKYPNESHNCENLVEETRTEEKMSTVKVKQGESVESNGASNVTLLYEIQAISCDPKYDGKIKIFKKTMTDITSLHIALSEDIMRLAQHHHLQFRRTGSVTGSSSEQPDNQKFLKMDLGNIELIKITGKMLDALHKFNRRDSDLSSYRDEILTGFLNACLESELPINASNALMDFFDLHNTVTCIPISKETSSIGDIKDGNERNLVEKRVHSDVFEGRKRIYDVLSNCDSMLIRAEKMQQEVVEVPENSPSISHEYPKVDDDQPQHSLLELPVTTIPKKSFPLNHSGMHEALMTVMAERDEIHARLVSANVLHTHEIDQERKKTERLRLRCDSLEGHIDGGSAASNAFFIGTDVVEKERRRKISEMVQDMDAELLALCKQLATEISAKTSATLEIIRLKESQQILQEKELAEREAIEDKLEQLTIKLRDEENRRADAEAEASKWKNSYEALLGRTDEE